MKYHKSSGSQVGQAGSQASCDLVILDLYILVEDSQKWRRSESEVAQVCPTLWDPMGYSPPGSSLPGILQARRLGWIAVAPTADLPNPEMEPRSLAYPAFRWILYHWTTWENWYSILVNVLWWSLSVNSHTFRTHWWPNRKTIGSRHDYFRNLCKADIFLLLFSWSLVRKKI